MYILCDDYFLTWRTHPFVFLSIHLVYSILNQARSSMAVVLLLKLSSCHLLWSSNFLNHRAHRATRQTIGFTRCFMSYRLIPVAFHSLRSWTDSVLSNRKSFMPISGAESPSIPTLEPRYLKWSILSSTSTSKAAVPEMPSLRRLLWLKLN